MHYAYAEISDPIRFCKKFYKSPRHTLQSKRPIVVGPHSSFLLSQQPGHKVTRLGLAGRLAKQWNNDGLGKWVGYRRHRRFPNHSSIFPQDNVHKADNSIVKLL